MSKYQRKPTPPGFIKAGDLYLAIGIPRQHARGWRLAGVLPPVHGRGRDAAYLLDDVMEFLRSEMVARRRPIWLKRLAVAAFLFNEATKEG